MARRMKWGRTRESPRSSFMGPGESLPQLEFHSFGEIVVAREVLAGALVLLPSGVLVTMGGAQEERIGHFRWTFLTATHVFVSGRGVPAIVAPVAQRAQPRPAFASKRATRDVLADGASTLRTPNGHEFPQLLPVKLEEQVFPFQILQ